MLTPKCIIPSLLHPPYQLNCYIHSHDCIISIPLVQQISFSSSIAIFSLYINEVSYNTSPEISQLKCAIKKSNPVKRKQSTFLKIKYDNLMAFDKYCYHTSKKTLYNIYHMAYRDFNIIHQALAYLSSTEHQRFTWHYMPWESTNPTRDITISFTPSSFSYIYKQNFGPLICLCCIYIFFFSISDLP